MAAHESKCLFPCKPGARTPVEELYGAVYRDKDCTCVTFHVSKGGCGDSNEACVCQYCFGCPFYGWNVTPCYTNQKGDCYCGASGNSIFTMIVVDKDKIRPMDCGEAVREQPQAPATQEMAA